MKKIKANQIVISIDNKGYIVDITNCSSASLFPVEETPLLRIGVEEKLFRPKKAVFNDNKAEIEMENGFKVFLKIEEKEKYATITVDQIIGQCDTLIFGPYPTALGDIIGEVIGVVRAKGFAMGVQALNIKTIAGFPLEYKEEAYKEYASDKYMSEISVMPVDYFKSAAYEAEFGSILQLYCNDRSRMRTRLVMDHKNVPVPAMSGPDSKIEGAAFAIFGCEEKEILSVIERIELDEGLPHPMLGGEWAKLSRESMRSYLITGFNENNFDRILEYAIEGGFKHIYHPEPFSDWGHFTLRKDHFPNGDISLIKMSEKAAEKGIGLGLHTLTNFTTTNDAYVSPVPHKDLAVRGQASLLYDIEEDDDEITVSEKEIFEEVSYLSTVWIDDELIQYTNVISKGDAFVLTGCKRGAFGTAPSKHKAGSIVKKLWDHAYRVFFPNVKLQDAYCDRLIELFNKAGLVQISFDGLEGCRYSGEDEYAVNRFCMRCWNGWNHNVINDASQLTHNLWHMNTRMNWGEPWGAKMREGMIDYRVKNQEFFKKNLFPRMLGWFLVRLADKKFEATSLEDIEWMLSKAAGFDAGFALVVNPEVFDNLGIINKILNTVKMWEELRLNDAFTDEIKNELKREDTEWHLKYEENGVYKLFRQDIQTFTCDLGEMQPGQPGGADWVLDNKLGADRFLCRIRVEGNGYIENPVLTTTSNIIRFECRINNKQYLVFDNYEHAYITDQNYNKICEVAVSGDSTLKTGVQSLSFSCDFGGDEAPEATVTIVTRGVPYEIII